MSSLWFDDLARSRENAYFRARDAELIAQMKKNDVANPLDVATGLPVEQPQDAQQASPEVPEKREK